MAKRPSGAPHAASATGPRPGPSTPRPAAAPRGPREPGGRDALVLTLFFMSGASGLVYEILFSRILHLLMGSTVYSITTVLTAFMGGLALGAFIGGRRAGRIAHPVRAYAYCELGIGLLALAVPLLLELLTPVFRLLYAHVFSTFWSFSILSFLLCALVLLPPTTLMGATLPILTEGLSRRGAMVGRSAGRLYAVNTMGAFFGATLSGFVLVPTLGQLGTLLVGVAINLALFGIIVRTFPALPAGAAPAPAETSGSTAADRGSATVFWIVAAAYAANGYAAMLYQVGWTRATALSLGSSTYTFTIIVAAFIFGLASGAAVMARFVDRLRTPLVWLGSLEIGVGLSAAVVVPLFGNLPLYAYDVIKKNQGSFGQLVAAELLFLFALIAVPTFFMGALFPLCTRLLRENGGGDSAASAVGLTYAVNTLGTITGAFTTGFLLIPSIGVQATLLLGSALNVLFGAAAWILPWPPPRWRAAVLAGILLAAFPASRAMPTWDRTVLISAPYLLNPDFEEMRSRKASGGLSGPSDEIVFWEDDPNVNVAVVKIGAGYALKLNGKTDASTFQDMPTQRLAGHLPVLLHPDPKDVCVIGMGSGVTGGAAAIHPAVERLDQVEIARAVIDAGRFFSSVNHDILENPKVKFIEADGRVHVLFTPEKYDVIISEPSNPWIAGIGNLFTVDYYKESRERLKPGGIMSAWVQTYRMSREGVQTVMRSFREAFPDITVWTASPGDLILLGSRDGVTLDLGKLRERVADPALASDMQPLLIGDGADLVSHLVLSPTDVERVVAGGSRKNTDDNGWLEFHAPKVLYASENVLRSSEAVSVSGIADLPFPVTGSDADKAAFTSRLPMIFAAKRKAMEAEDAMEALDIIRTERLARESLAMNPREHHATMILAQVLTAETGQLTKTGKVAEALPRLEELARIYPTYPQLPFRLAEAYLKSGRYQDAMPWIDKLKVLDPEDPVVLYNRGLALLSLGRTDEGAAELEAVVKRQPEDVEAWLALGNARHQKGSHGPAIEAYDRALSLRPAYFEAAFNRANALWGMKDHARAMLAFEELLARGGEGTPNVLTSIATLALEMGDPARALQTIAPLMATRSDVPQLRMLRARALLAAGKAREATEDFEWLAGKSPKTLAVQLGRGDAWERAGDPARAQEAFARAREIDAAATEAFLRDRARSTALPPVP